MEIVIHYSLKPLGPLTTDTTANSEEEEEEDTRHHKANKTEANKNKGGRGRP